MKVRVMKKYFYVWLMAMLIAIIPAIDVMAEEQGEEYYYEEADPELEIEYADGGTSILRSGGPYKFDWNIDSKKEKQLNSKISLKKGKSIIVNAKFSSTTNVKVGIVDSNNKYTLKPAKSKIDIPITAPKNGTYHLVIQNKSGKKITVSGSYRY